jgi:hypothetical protein
MNLKNDNIDSVHGALSIIKTNTETGEITQELYIPNVVVNLGKAWIAARMVGTPTVMGYMGLGDSTTEEAVDQSVLGHELTASGYGRRGLTTATSSGSIITYATNFEPGCPSVSSVITEAGIFNASTNGTMLARTKFAQVTKSAADALSITWTITLA